MLPPLQGEVRVKDETGAGFDSVARNAERANRTLERTQAIADQAAQKVERMSRSRGLGDGDLFGNLIPDQLDTAIEALDQLEERFLRMRQNMEALGRPNMGGLLSQLGEMNSRVEQLRERHERVNQGIERNAGGYRRIADALSKLDDAPLLRQIPGVEQIAKVGDLGKMLPNVAQGALKMAGALGLVTAAAGLAVGGVKLLWDEMERGEEETARENLLARRLEFKPSEVEQAVDDLRTALNQRLSESEALDLISLVDLSGPIDSIDEFIAIARTTQRFADEFGLPWQDAIRQVTEAIQTGNTAALEQMGIIRDGNKVIDDYAASVNRTADQLTERGRGEALIAGILAENESLMNQALTPAQALREEHERLSQAVADSKSALLDWAASLAEPSLEAGATWWEQQLERVTESIRATEASFSERAQNNRVLASLSEVEAADYASLLQRKRQLEDLKAGTEEALARATEEGADPEIVAQFQADVEGLNTSYEELLQTIDEVRRAVRDGREEFDVPAADELFPIPGIGGRLSEFGRVPISALAQEEQDRIDETEADLERRLNDARGRLDQIARERRDAWAQSETERFQELGQQIEQTEAEIADLERRLSEIADNPLRALAPGLAIPFEVELNIDHESIQDDFMRQVVGVTEEAAAVISNDDSLRRLEERRNELFRQLEEANAQHAALSQQLAAELALPVEQQDHATVQLLEEYVSLLEEKRSLLIQAQALIAGKGIDSLGIFDTQVDPILANIDQAIEETRGEIEARGVELASTLTAAADEQTAIILSAVDGYRQGQERILQALDDTTTSTAAGTVGGAVEERSESLLRMIGLLEDADARAERFLNRLDEARPQSFRVAAVEMDEGPAAEEATEAYRVLTAVKERLATASLTENEISRHSVTIRQANADAAVAEAGALDASAANKQQEATATALLAQSYEQTVVAQATYLAQLAVANAEEDNNIEIAGLLFDSYSRLPVAFDTAGASALQLADDFATLEAQIAQLEASAIQAGFSVANRLVPVLGLGGALQQTSVFAEQARAVRETFDALNESRVSQGRDPLGAQVLDSALGALQQNWNAQATDMLADMRDVGGGAGNMADAFEQATERMNQALDGLISSVLKDTTKGLIPLDELLPREDAVDEPARRMADVAVKGFTSPWFEGLKGLFPDEVLAEGEGKIREFATRMVRDHQQGLSFDLFDTDAAAEQVLQLVRAKEEQAKIIEEIREKVKGQAEVDDLDIMEALGIDVTPQRAASAVRQSATAMTLSFEEIIAQLQSLGDGESSPIVDLFTVDEEGTTTIAGQGTTAMETVGEAIVAQAEAGSYGKRSIDAIITDFETKQADLEQAGQKLADWMGGALLDRFEESIPTGLLDILVVQLVPLILAAQAESAERSSGAS